ncbi:hypothetical protein BO71DRAFT_227939 [Aspergillus ellipticus CBS 707.79]|uniref:Secreted protein n=1 Tax=Aspergillus ellipticus CBS 707.79 TaxID=1448320 RepID=A0A319DT18_9EURO|nr:hypothetical protein BO71DRAFT_227939 [Aspergillus ellipticus CBS 707.79]
MNGFLSSLFCLVGHAEAWLWQSLTILLPQSPGTSLRLLRNQTPWHHANAVFPGLRNPLCLLLPAIPPQLRRSFLALGWPASLFIFVISRVPCVVRSIYTNGFLLPYVCFILMSHDHNDNQAAITQFSNLARSK